MAEKEESLLNDKRLLRADVANHLMELQLDKADGYSSRVTGQQELFSGLFPLVVDERVPSDVVRVQEGNRVLAELRAVDPGFVKVFDPYCRHVVAFGDRDLAAIAQSRCVGNDEHSGDHYRTVDVAGIPVTITWPQ